MTLLVVNDDGSLRDPIHPTIQYVPYGWCISWFAEGAKCLLSANRAVQTIAQLNIALGANAFNQR